MSGFFQTIAIPLGFLMKLCYFVLKNYAVSLVVFTFIIRLILFPLGIKQQKSTAKMQKFAPDIEKLKKKYAKDQARLSEETMKLYQENGVSMSSSCLPMIVTMLVLFAMIEVIYAPLKYVSPLSKDEVTEATTRVSNLITISAEIGKDTTFNQLLAQNATDPNVDDTTEMVKYFDDHTDDISQAQLTVAVEKLMLYKDAPMPLEAYFNDDSKVSKQLKNRPELVIFSLVQEDGYGDVFDAHVKEVVSDFHYTIFGTNMGQYPKVKSVLVLFPLITFAAQMLTTLVSMHYMKKNQTGQNTQMMKSMRVMFFIMPLFSLYIGFNFPIGLSVYWITSSLLAMVQTILVNKIYTPAYVDKLVARDIERHKEKRKGRQTFMQKALEARKEALGQNRSDSEDADTAEEAEDIDESKLSRNELKELNKKRLNEARRRMAEKYGEEYIEE
ncbi:MAG: membrane protein insertase YidC [Oscillospiraceae bacterium]